MDDREPHSLSLRTFLARYFAQRSVVVAADEDDAPSHAALHDVLTELGAKVIKEEWGVVGAIELTWTTVLVGDERLIVDQVSDVGTTLRGSAALVSRIAARVREGLP
jgi:hypothetical protein